MPRGDRTGPVGMGPMTGRAGGFCAGGSAPGYVGPSIGWGRGIGRGFGGGGGWGWRNMYNAPGQQGELDPDVQRQALKNQADALQAELDLMKKRLSDLETVVTPE